MSLNRANPTGWATNDQLTHNQINVMDANIANAVDKTSAGDTIVGPLQLSGAGRIRLGIQAGANADTTYTVGSFNELQLTSSILANRTYTLSSTGASSGDILTIWADPSFSYVVTVLDNLSSNLITIGNVSTSEASWAEFIYSGSAWLLHKSSRGSVFTQLFTSSGTWIAPPNVTTALLLGCGGGGGGGGGAHASGSSYGCSGAGGGGAYASYIPVTVTPGTTYTITIGTGGTGGLGSSSGNAAAGADGTDTTFGTLASFSGAGGGAGGVMGGSYAIGGAPMRGLGPMAGQQFPGQGGNSGNGSTYSGYPGNVHTTGPSNGGISNIARGGGGGASGYPAGNGGSGGNVSITGTASTVGLNGTLGAGGGGGGGGGDPATVVYPNGSQGGNGGNGALLVRWVR